MIRDSVFFSSGDLHRTQTQLDLLNQVNQGAPYQFTAHDITHAIYFKDDSGNLDTLTLMERSMMDDSGNFVPFEANVSLTGQLLDSGPMLIQTPLQKNEFKTLYQRLPLQIQEKIPPIYTSANPAIDKILEDPQQVKRSQNYRSN